VGNIDLDPLFARAPSDGGDGWGVGGNDDFGDLRLRTGSPCIDAGRNSVIPPDATDLDGDGNRSEPLPLDLNRYMRFFRTDPTKQDTPADLGAYEYLPDCNGNGLADLCETSCGSANGVCDRPGCGAKPDCNHNSVPDECEPANICQTIYGDLDMDGDVDQSDFGVYQRCVGLNMAIHPECATSDLDFNGSVGFPDALLFFKCMTGPDHPINTNCRP